jgi:hypothetical protein
LIKAIELLVEIKNKINKLVSFFSAIKEIVTFVVEGQVKPFIKKVEQSNTGESTDLDKPLGGWTLSQLDCQVYF